MVNSPHGVNWTASDVARLPFEDERFDLAICQQGLQFFPDKPAALAEILRVLKPGSKFVLTCWRTISPLFQAVSDSLRLHLNEGAAQQALMPFSFRDPSIIARLIEDAGFPAPEQSVLVVRRAFADPQPAIREEILASPYEAALREKGEQTIFDVARDVLTALEEYREEGILMVPQEATLFQAVKPQRGSQRSA